jgi:hypothetical protein
MMTVHVVVTKIPSTPREVENARFTGELMEGMK